MGAVNSTFLLLASADLASGELISAPESAIKGLVKLGFVDQWERTYSYLNPGTGRLVHNGSAKLTEKGLAAARLARLDFHDDRSLAN